MEVTASMVMALRKKTGLSMMDCKKALVETGGDEQKAIDWLRERGLKKAADMVDREAGEGRVACFLDDTGRNGAFVEVRCETAPVANTDDFINLANAVARQAALAEAPSPDNIRDEKLADDPSRTVGDLVNDVFNRLRENIQIARIAKMTGHLGTYVHHDGRKGAMAEFSGDCPAELAAGVCQHITAMNPSSLRREDVDAAEIEPQRAMFQKEAEGKPPQVAEKMIEGKLGRWFSEFVLLEQPYVRDDKKSVGEALREARPELTINRFVRFTVGGG